MAARSSSSSMRDGSRRCSTCWRCRVCHRKSPHGQRCPVREITLGFIDRDGPGVPSGRGGSAMLEARNNTASSAGAAVALLVALQG
eukprot:2917903-Pyramimonas_sp.AAC.1